jgi:uncharacterized OB-fold protein
VFVRRDRRRTGCVTILLQRCGACGRINYPPRELCRDCLGDTLAAVPVSGHGVLLARTTLHVSAAPVFRERLPWRTGSVALEGGAILIVHLTAGAGRIGQAVVVRSGTLDGRAAFFADPATPV